MKNFFYIFLLACLFTGWTASFPEAKSTDEISKERSAVMKKIDHALNDISQRVGGLFPFKKDKIREDAEILKKGLTALYTLFPKGSATTATLPVIWEEPEKFKMRIDKNIKRADKLLAETETADRARVKKLYKSIENACKKCHSRYRK